MPFHILQSAASLPIRPHSTKYPEPPNSLPHLTQSSEIHIISVSQKAVTHRVALAIGHVTFSNPRIFQLIQQNLLKKGDVLAVARVAGIRAIKIASDIIPLAHSGLNIDGAIVKIEAVPGVSETSTPSSSQNDHNFKIENRNGVDDKLVEAMQLDLPIGVNGGIRIAAQVETTAKTGVEMEALSGVMGAALTIVDMVKSVDRGVSIEGVKVVGKRGGRSGGWGVWVDESMKP